MVASRRWDTSKISYGLEHAGIALTVTDAGAIACIFHQRIPVPAKDSITNLFAWYWNQITAVFAPPPESSILVKQQFTVASWATFHLRIPLRFS